MVRYLFPVDQPVGLNLSICGGTWRLENNESILKKLEFKIITWPKTRILYDL